ncbi:hypothetical protein J2Z20_002626 [Paenibacillus sediminis]|uniref:Uncharacterized protein n=1 Tax=Paenibacillus sediminis TaxID=664909 RepID=A0ABS4H5C1_9BACL|nr:hypothetical protein [Paenibacillus sediminis]
MRDIINIVAEEHQCTFILAVVAELADAHGSGEREPVR